MPRVEPKPWVELEDIQANSEYWNQKISLIEFKDKNGKIYWNKDYNFIPHWQRYNKAVKWIKETDFPLYNCKIVWNANNEIEIVTQNYFGKVIEAEQAIEQIIRKIKRKIIKEINQPVLNAEKAIEIPEELAIAYQKQKGEIPLGPWETKEGLAQYIKELEAELPEEPNVDELIKQDLETLLTFKTYEEFSNSPYSYIYEQELEELKSTEIKKGKLSEKDLEKQSYDFARPDLAILWRKQLYFIDGWKYIDNYTLFVQIKAKKCPLFLYYWNWMLKIRGTGIVEKAPKLIKESQKDLMESSRLHYDFCDDLGLKRIYHNEMGYQPKFSLFMAQLNIEKNNVYFSEQKTKTAEGQEGKQLVIPTNLGIKKCQNTKEEIKTALKNSKAGLWEIIGNVVGVVFKRDGLEKLTEKIVGSKVFVSVGPEEHTNGNSFYSNMSSHQDILFSDNKKVGEQYKEWFKKQPHLLDHTTFQFIFLNDIAMSANAQFLGIKYDKDKDQFILPYKTFINHSPGNLYYRWEMGHIAIKCEIKTIGMFEDHYNPLRVLGNISFTSPQVGGGWVTPGAGTGPWHAGGASIGWNNKSSMGDLETNNIKPDKKEKRNNEKIFDKWKKDLDKGVEPSAFTSDTINFNYSLGEFFNRLTSPVFFYRTYISQLLYNKLEKWCNGKSEILGLPLQWEDLASWTQGSKKDNEDTRKLGKWKWSEVLLESDVDGFFTNIMEQGYFLDGGDKLKNPNLGMEIGRNFIKGAANAWDTTMAEEKWKKKRELVEELIKFDITNADYNNVDYIGSPDDNIWQELNRANNDVHTGTSPFNNNCLGCLCGGGSHGNPNYNFERVYNFTSGGKLVLKTRGSGVQECQIPTKGGTVTFKAVGNTATLTLKYEKITRESYFVEKKTKTQEIDQEQLDNEIDGEIENLEGEKEDEEEIEKESGAGGVGDGLEKERERENEDEDEKETETEQEEETEQEDEKEKETETEKEKETETEKEKETETEKEKEKENEDE